MIIYILTSAYAVDTFEAHRNQPNIIENAQINPYTGV